MDDRHSLSEPRPLVGCSDGLPTWEVDVFREGVADPLLTLQINNETLPPRLRKKKVIWKLPESTDQIPSFGSDEKRRIWDLFKQQKKSRRKSSKKESNNNNGKKVTEVRLVSKETEAKTKVKSPPPTDCAGVPKVEKEIPPMNGSNGSNGSSHHGSDFSGDPPGLGNSVQSSKNGTAPLPPPPPPPPGLFQETQLADKAVSSFLQSAEAQIMDSSPTPTATAEPLENVQSLLSATPTEPPAPQAPPPGFVQSPPQPQLKRNAFCVSLESPNIPVQLAKCVIELYYKLVSAGNTELYNYFAPGVQKSLSAGGAHHVCVSQQEILLQIQSLLHSQWQVRGVVAQEGIHDSVVLLITGSVICGAPQPEKMSYCHSLTLIPISDAGEYQIHNDALAFLSNKE